MGILVIGMTINVMTMKKSISFLLLLTATWFSSFTLGAEARATCAVGQRGEVLWKGKWYPAQVLDTSGRQCYITYDGYSSSWDEWIGPSRFRPYAPASSNSAYRAGQSVQILWKGKWYPGRVLDVSGNRYFITYDGYSSSWNEWVGPARLSR